jgi:hypothetical protein
MRWLTNGVCIELLTFDQKLLSPPPKISRERLLMIACASVTDPSVGGGSVRNELVSFGHYPFFVCGEGF